MSYRKESVPMDPPSDYEPEDGPFFFHGEEIYEAPEFLIPPKRRRYSHANEFMVSYAIHELTSNSERPTKSITSSVHPSLTANQASMCLSRPTYINGVRRSLATTGEGLLLRENFLPQSKFARLYDRARQGVELGYARIRQQSAPVPPTIKHRSWVYQGKVCNAYIELRPEKNRHWSSVWGEHSMAVHGYHNYSHLLWIQPPMLGTMRIGLPLHSMTPSNAIYIRAQGHTLEILCHDPTSHMQPPGTCKLGMVHLPDFIKASSISLDVDNGMLVADMPVKESTESTHIDKFRY